MDHWDEVRTAYQVARLGTVSGAAEVLGVHHATVIRHIDALEGRLGVKLFQRHARGYTPTEAGQDLLKVAKAADDQFHQLGARLKGHGDGVTGDLTVTSLASFSTMLTPVMVKFQKQNPEVKIRYLTGDRLFRLEYGEAHVAIRAGAAPDQPDNVVQPFIKQTVAMVAAQSYIDRMGMPENDADLAQHEFVSHDDSDSRAPFHRWLLANVPSSQIVYRTMDNRSMRDAIAAGAGIGFLPSYEFGMMPGVKQIMPPREEWSTSLWLVTHVDLHRTPKVQTFLKFLKEEAKSWVE
ncbi:MAG: LysR family transcriptional regulator [Marivivens sp.]|uniref:LysR family transcriptional regulator n=1 Tax=Marivivens sp. TaxID=1978374 RepID=UPI0017ACCCF7|nr:LysR family transcriptional regulator [Marivivens sp.]NVJ94123.1 LysR family transcriptional regulator [Marivivens sp.]